MTITLTPSTPSVAANAPWGKVIGTFNNSKVRLINDSPAGYFGVTANTLRVAWHAIQATPGTYQVTVSAPRETRATFNVVISATAPPPPPPISPDGSIISGGTGSLQTADGTWTFGPVASGAWEVFLNGSWAATGIADKLEVANGGKMYAHNAGGWWVWQSGSWQLTADPNTPPPPARTLVLSLGSVPASFPDNSPAGTVITTATVKYSDGTIPTAPTITSSDPTFAKISGMQIVTARPLISGPQSSGGDDYTHLVTITASDGLGSSATARLFG